MIKWAVIITMHIPGGEGVVVVGSGGRIAMCGKHIQTCQACNNNNYYNLYANIQCVLL